MHFKYKQYKIRLFYALLGDLINADNVLQKKSIELCLENHLNYFGRGGPGTGTQKLAGTLTGIRTGTQTGTCTVNVKIYNGPKKTGAYHTNA
jgi:hypothetical protein